MNEMVERVARVICASVGDDPDAIGDTPVCPMCGHDSQMAVRDHAFPRWVAYIDQARAAIAALRVPTDAMTLAGAASYGKQDWFYVLEAAGVWQAMIAAILEEK